MEKNGRNSCTGNSRNIDIKYFFVKDRVSKKEIKIVYCPSEQMLADFFKNPLNGRLFHTFRDVIMGYRPITDLYEVKDISVKERVENTPKESFQNMTENLIKENSEKRNMTWSEVVTKKNKMTNR